MSTLSPEAERIREDCPLEILRIDSRYQRHLSNSWVEQKVKCFKPQLLGVLHTNMRDDNELYVVDGQHRLALLRRIGWQVAPCIVHMIPTRDEPRLFVELQEERRAITTVDRHRAMVQAGDARALQVDTALKRLGIPIVQGGTYKRDGQQTIRGTREVYRALDRGGYEHLLAVLATLSKAWRDDPAALASPLIEGMSIFIGTYGNEVTVPTVAEKLGLVTPTRLITLGREFSANMGSTTGISIARSILTTYNKGRRSNRLDETKLIAYINLRKGNNLKGSNR